MQIVIHRVNTVEGLKNVPAKYWVEIDIRAYWDELILHHEPFIKWELFEEYLKYYKHSFVVLNIKTDGIEERVIGLMKKYNIKDYFLLDVEFPYIYRAARQWVKEIAMRYSEDECIETVLKYKWKVDRIWIDTNTQLPLDSDVIKQMNWFKTCLVCPERWWRPEDIPVYIAKMKDLGFRLDAVMTAFKYVDKWDL